RRTFGVVTTRGPAARARRWRALMRLEVKLEGKGRQAYGGWTAGVRRDVLSKFDEATGRKAAGFDFSAVVPAGAGLQEKLKQAMRPSYASTIEATWNFTVEEIGIPTFEIDDPALARYVEARSAKMAGGTPVTLPEAVRRQLLAGVEGGETVQAIRARLVHV